MHRGQLILEVVPQRQHSFIAKHFDQLSLLTKFVVGVLLILSVFGMIQQQIQATLTLPDILVYFTVGIVSIVIYLGVNYVVQSNIEGVKSGLEKDPLGIYEYGIELPPVITGTDSLYLTFNEILSIDVQIRPTISFTLHTPDTNYTIDLDYLELTDEIGGSQQVLKEQLARTLMKIRENLELVENRDHPTIIPKAYFRDIFN